MESENNSQTIIVRLQCTALPLIKHGRTLITAIRDKIFTTKSTAAGSDLIYGLPDAAVPRRYNRLTFIALTFPFKLHLCICKFDKTKSVYRWYFLRTVEKFYSVNCLLTGGHTTSPYAVHEAHSQLFRLSYTTCDGQSFHYYTILFKTVFGHPSNQLEFDWTSVIETLLKDSFCLN